MSEKPYRGKMIKANRCTWQGDSYFSGYFEGHPNFHGKYGHTSIVVEETPGPGYIEVETLNSRYTVVLKEKEQQKLDIT